MALSLLSFNTASCTKRAIYIAIQFFASHLQNVFLNADFTMPRLPHSHAPAGTFLHSVFLRSEHSWRVVADYIYRFGRREAAKEIRESESRQAKGSEATQVHVYYNTTGPRYTALLFAARIGLSRKLRACAFCQTRSKHRTSFTPRSGSPQQD